MSTGFIIQSGFEFILVVALIVGLIFFDDKLARWEAKIWRRIKERVISAVRYGK